MRQRLTEIEANVEDQRDDALIAQQLAVLRQLQPSARLRERNRDRLRISAEIHAAREELERPPWWRRSIALPLPAAVGVAALAIFAVGALAFLEWNSSGAGGASIDAGAAPMVIYLGGMPFNGSKPVGTLHDQSLTLKMPEGNVVQINGVTLAAENPTSASVSQTIWGSATE